MTDTARSIPSVPDLHPAESFRRFFETEWRRELRQNEHAQDRILAGEKPPPWVTAEDVRLLGLRVTLAAYMFPEGSPA